MKTEIIKIDTQKPDKRILKGVAEIVEKGGLVAFPTETVYGIGADYLNKKAIKRLYEVKKRPKGKPFTVHISRFEQLTKLTCMLTLYSKGLIERFWPGPLTMVFKTASDEKIGVRMPSNRVALEFISECRNPIVAPSANLSGNTPARNPQEVLQDLNGRIDALLDGGQTEVGVESTVLDVSEFPFRMLRKGAIEGGRIADVGRELHRKFLSPSDNGRYKEEQ